MRLPLLRSLLWAAPCLLPAQANVIPGLGSRLADLNGLQAFGRVGAWPNGRNGLAAGVSVCNNGSQVINWLAVMNPDHPFYAFLLCRESGGRFVQISDWSYCKHGFASLNSDCGTCVPPAGGSTQLGVGCGDTYGAPLNAGRDDLGPPGEIDPWLLTWNPVGSHFDRGEPSVLPPANSDGLHSLTSAMTAAMDGVKHRIEVDDQDLDVPGATFYYAGRVLTRGEAESSREDNLQSRRFVPTWNGSSWSISSPGGMTSGTPLNQWTGATLRSGSNGISDGRVWIACKVTPLADGRWHYEYALHNRDNSRGIAGVRIAKCPTARIFAAGFRDIDRSTFNDWSIDVSGNQLTVLAGADNPLDWNMIFNVWFDSDAAPLGATATLDAARPGAGALQFPVLNVPSPMRLANEFLGGGCGSPAPALTPTGNPALGDIPNPSFGLHIAAHPNAAVATFGGVIANVPIGGCILHLDPVIAIALASGVTDATGNLALPLPVPAIPTLEGLDFAVQAAELFAGGPLFGQFNASNGMRLRVGNSRSGCP